MKAVKLRPEVRWFAEQIELRMRKHDGDKGDSYKEMDEVAVRGYFAHRHLRLLAEMDQGETIDGVVAQAAGMGAAAMFVAINKKGGAF